MPLQGYTQYLQWGKWRWRVKLISKRWVEPYRTTHQCISYDLIWQETWFGSHQMNVKMKWKWIIIARQTLIHFHFIFTFIWWLSVPSEIFPEIPNLVTSCEIADNQASLLSLPSVPSVEQQNLHKAFACHTLSLPLLFTMHRGASAAGT